MATPTRRIALLVAAYLAVAGAGCKKDEDTETRPFDTLTADEACAGYAASRCALITACVPNGIARSYGDDATCLARETLACTNALAAPGSGNDPENVLACVRAFTSSCADFMNDNPPPACRPPAGQRAAGEPCHFDDQCRTRFCSLPRAAACGTCAAPPTAGSSCALDARCGFNMVCAKLSRTCTPWGTNGAPCAAGDDTCGYGLGCTGATDLEPGTCQPLAVQGDGGVCAQCVNAAADNGACDTAGASFGCMAPARCVGTALDGGEVGTCTVPAGSCR